MSSQVDRLDQKISYYPFVRKTAKWTSKFVMYLFQIALVNAHIIYKMKNEVDSDDDDDDDDVPKRKPPMKMRKFILETAKAWTKLPLVAEEAAAAGAAAAPEPAAEAAAPAPPPPAPLAPTPRGPRGRDPENRFDIDFRGHVLQPINANPGQERPFRKCRNCLNRNPPVRKETQYVCVGCQYVPLCTYPCFFEYHQR